jgi:hypothetical protein
MEAGVGHREFRADAVEAQFAVGALEVERVRDRRLFAVEIPPVHERKIRKRPVVACATR